MANLAEAVDAAETDWIISADIPHDTEYLTVESEVVEVLAHFPGQPDPQTLAAVAPRIRVRRAAGGTTAASHADTTALTPLIPPAAAGVGAGGLTVTGAVSGAVADATEIIVPGAVVESSPGVATIGLVVSQIGPFQVTFANGALYGATGMSVADITPDTHVMRAYAYIGEDDAWVPDAGTARMSLYLRDAADLTEAIVLVDYDDITYSNNFAGYFGHAENTKLAAPEVATSVTASKLSAKVILGGGATTCTAGSADIYAIIATPAA